MKTAPGGTSAAGATPRTRIETGGTIDAKPSHIETGRWYDLKLVVSGKHVKCLLDGQLIHDVNYDSERQGQRAFTPCAATDEQSGDVIVKVVNASASPLDNANWICPARKI